jgi:uncharacterized protein YwgA
MNDYDEMKLARVIDACGGVDGRVKMQKIVYLLKAMGYDLPFHDFRIRQLGPFSPAVAWETDLLRSSGFVTERQQTLGSDPNGQPIVQYDYEVRPEIAALARKHFEVHGPPGKPPIDQIARELKAKDRAVLEVAATRLFLEREERLSGTPLHDELHRIKGHLQNRFGEADELVADLRNRKLL